MGKNKMKIILGSISITIVLIIIEFVIAQPIIFTTEADFDAGVYVNTMVVDDALTLTSEFNNPKYLWVANSAEGTVSKIDTDTNREVGRYRVNSSSAAADPSRTAVDLEGNVWVGNRRGDKLVHKIAGFPQYCIDNNGNGVIDTSHDANGDGIIQLTEMLPYGQDECVILSINLGCTATSYGSVGPRAVAIDLDGDVWIGCYSNQTYLKLNPNTGAVISRYSAYGTPYGAAVDGDGYIWTVNRDTNNVAKINPNTGARVANIPLSMPYGIAVDQGNTVWVSQGWASYNYLNRIANDYTLTRYTAPGGTSANLRGVSVDDNHKIWVADSSNHRVYRFDPEESSFSCTLSVGNTPIGVVRDHNGYIWAINQNTNNAMKIDARDPLTCSIVATIPTGRGPYTYSDATGSGLFQFINYGTWTYFFVPEMTGSHSISWSEANKQSDENIAVELFNGNTYQAITSESVVSLTGIQRIRVTLRRNSDGSSPIFDDLLIMPLDVCGNGIREGIEECDDGCMNGLPYVCELGIDDGDGCNSTCQIENNLAILELSDRTIEFDISYYPSGRLYNLHDMIDIPPTANLPCSMDELGYIVSDSDNFRVIGPNAAGEIILIPKSPDTNLPDWYNPASESLDVTIYCVDESLGGTEEITIYGNGDIILVTDFSGSMKKDIDSWREGSSVGSQYSDCLTRTYFEEDTRKTHVARCLDSELAEIVLSYENNRIWPLFIMRDEIRSYGGDPHDLSAVLDYLFSYPQGMEQTCLACAINEGYDILDQNSDEDRMKFIVLMTDGVPTHCAQDYCTSTSSLFNESSVCAGFCDTQGQNYCDEDDYYYGGIGGCLLDDEGCSQAEVNTMFSAGRAIQDMDVIFYTISFGLIENCPRSEYLLRPIAEMNDGMYNHSSNVDKLREIYQQIAYRILELTRVSSEYSITGAINDSAVLTINYVAPSPTCGNGIVDSAEEECDDGNDDNTDLCSNICTWTFCNDGTVQSPNGRDNLDEECDDGNTFDGDSCNNQCIYQYCGDGIAQPGLGEQCDNGFGYFNEECLENCMRGVPEPPRCGDNSSDVGEECDDGCRRGNPVLCELADNGDGCDQFCMLEDEPVLLLDDTTISFDYSYFPIGYYEYLLEAMVSRRYATLPCPDDSLRFSMSTSTNFSITGPDITDPLGNIHITPNNPDWTRSTSDTVEVDVSCFGVGETHQSSADLTIIYTGVGAPDGSITCASPTPRYLLRSGSQVSVGLNQIFSFTGTYGSINQISNQPTNNIIITDYMDMDRTTGGSGILAQSIGGFPVFETAQIRVWTDNGVYSEGYCPVIFFDMASNCDQDVCTACINNRDLSCFVDNNCLAETPVPVLNPFTPVRASRYVPAMAPPGYDADFQPLRESLFKINRLSGSGNSEIFNVSGEEAPHGTMNASVMTYTFTGFVGSTRVCPLLRRLNLSIGEESLDPVTDLLITGSRAVIGFYEWGGIRSKGPYIFTAKVWLR